MMKKFELLAAAAAITCITTAAAAQTQPATTSPAPSETGASSQVENIVVTAQRRSESSQSVPIAITAVSEAKIEAVGLRGASDLAAISPNLQVSFSSNETQPIFSIRGISMSDYATNIASPIAIYSDESYLGAVYTHGLAILDPSRIEVVRGPQGTLYGRNSTGGAINFISPTPALTGQPKGYLTLGYGNFKSFTGRGAVEAPLIDGKLSMRVAFSAQDDDGYYRNTLGGRMAETRFAAGRLTLHAKPVDGLDLVLRYTKGSSAPIAAPPRNEGAYPVDLSGYIRGPNLKDREGAIDYVGRVRSDLDLVSLATTIDLGSQFSLVSISSFYSARFQNNQDTDGSPNKTLEIQWNNREKGYSQDLRVASALDGPFNFIIGGYYGHQRTRAQNLYTSFGSGAAVVALSDPAYATLLGQYGRIDQRMTTTKESAALYSQGTFEFDRQLSLDIGLRYTRDTDRLEYVNISRLSATGAPIGSWVPGNTSGIDAPLLPPAFFPPNGIYLNGPYTLASAPQQRVRRGTLSGKASLNYKPHEGMLAYASFSRGYRSGTFNAGTYYQPRPVEQNFARPEFVDAYEVGFKADLLGRRLRLNGSAFHYDYRDQQFVNVVGVSTSLVNAPKSRISGLELEAVAAPARGLSLSASIGLLDAKFKQLSLADTTSALPGASVDLSGNRLISSPKFSTTLAADYERPIGDLMIRLHSDASYRSKQFYSAYNDKIGYGSASQDGYWLLNGRITLATLDDRYSVALWSKNLLNKKVDVYAINLVSGFGYTFHQEGPPRRYGVEIGMKF
jgi:iron complex outermembrane receptor protein